MDLLDRLSLDVPVGQAGMGGGLAGPELAAAVAQAGGLGTLGLAPAGQLRESIARVRECAPGRAVAVNLLTPFLRRSQVSVCVRDNVDAAVVAFGNDRELVDELGAAGVFVLVMVGTQDQARRAIQWGADGLIAQGGEAGGHLSGTTDALRFLPRAIAIANGRPVLLAGGIATGADTRAALSAGADGVVAGTRFLLTHESRAHPECRNRALVPCRRNGQGGRPSDHAWQRDSGQAPGNDRGAEAADSGAAGVLPDRPDRRNACIGGRPRRLLRG